MLFEYSIKTEERNLYNITAKVKEALYKSGINDGICVVYCPHTTAGITINENADPDVVIDMLTALDKTFPDYDEYRHVEGNSAAHMKSSCVGTCKTIIVENGDILRGIWQGIYFCEFDGPRNRTFYVKIMGQNPA